MEDLFKGSSKFESDSISQHHGDDFSDRHRGGPTDNQSERIDKLNKEQKKYEENKKKEFFTPQRIADFIVNGVILVMAYYFAKWSYLFIYWRIEKRK